MTEQRIIRTDRYPGPKPYEEDEKDLFFGRSQETESLFESVSVNNVFVLHAESGLGKSSLIAAGLIPRLRTGAYLPVLIRFKNRKAHPVKAVAEALHEAIKKKSREESKEVVFTAVEENDAWKLVKKANLLGCIPVLIFDQFEEFSYFPDGMRAETVQKLAELTSLRLPDYIRKESSGTDVPANWFSQPEVKLIFSIRTDRIGVMEEFAEAIPDTRSQRYELSPLMAGQGEQVIMLPAAMESTDQIIFNSQPFQYEPELISTILDIVKRNKTIDTTQLQIICLEIQERAKNKVPAEDGQLPVITAAELGGKEGLADLVKNFYIKQLNKIGEKEDITPAERLAIRILLEIKLIVQGKKDRLSEDSIFQHFRNRDISEERIKPLLDALLSLRLIRGLDFEESTFYEIAHDTLINPILQEKHNRELDEKLDKEKKLAEEKAREQAEELRKQRIQTAKEVELRKQAILAQQHAKQEELKAREAEEKARDAERQATSSAEELQKSLAQLRESNRKQQRLRRAVAAFSIILFIASMVILVYILNTKQKINSLTAYKALATADSSYLAGNHHRAYSQYLDAVELGNSDAEARIDSLVFSPITWENEEAITYSPDTSLCYLIDPKTKSAEVWSLKENKPARLADITGMIQGLFSPDNRYLVYITADSSVHLWDIEQQGEVELKDAGNINQQTASNTLYTDFIKHAYFPHKNYCIIYGRNNKLVVLAVAGSKLQATYSGLGQYISASVSDVPYIYYDRNKEGYINTSPVNISADGNYLAQYNPQNGNLFIYNLATRSRIQSFSNIARFNFHPSLPLFFLLDNGGNFMSRECREPKKFPVLPPDAGNPMITEFTFSPDGDRIFMKSKKTGRFEYAYDFIANRYITRTDKIVNKVYADLVMSDQNILTRYSEDNFTWQVSQFGTAATTEIVATRYYRFEKMNRSVYIDTFSKMHILDSRSLREVHVSEPLSISNVFILPDSGKIYFNNSSDNEIVEYDIRNPGKRTTVHAPGSITGVTKNKLALNIEKKGMNFYCLTAPGALYLKGAEKLNYLQELFRFRK